MICQEITSRLGEYVAGALDRADLARVETHVDVCDVCCRALSEIRWLETALRSVSPPVVMPARRPARAPFGVGRIAAAVVFLVVALTLTSQCFDPRGGAGSATNSSSARLTETVDSELSPAATAAELYRVRSRLNTLEGVNAVLATRVVELEQLDQSDDGATGDDDADGVDRWQLLVLPSMNKHRSRTHSSAMPRIK